MPEGYSSPLPFRPSSLDDFNQYAKALSRLIEEPLQRCHQLLARAYGYEDLHAMQLAMREPAGRAGPFGRTVLDDLTIFFSEPQFIEGIRSRSDRLLDLVAQYKQLGESQQLSARYAKVRELGLFDTPAEQRIASKRVFNALNILEGKSVSETIPGETREGIHAYAYLAQADSGEYYACLTRTGAAVRDALDEIFPLPGPRPESEFIEQGNIQRQRALDIMKAHPDCPWPLAYIVIRHAQVLAQGSWTGPLFYLDAEFIYPKMTGTFQSEVVKNARQLLPDVYRAVGMFDVLYKDITQLVCHFDPEVGRRIDYDVLTWPALLYWGGMVAANAGERDYAIRLLKRAVRINGISTQDRARDALCALVLEEGSRAVAACYQHNENEAFDNPSVWEGMARAAALSQEALSRSALNYLGTMLYSETAIEVFNPGWEPVSPGPSDECDANGIQQFMFLSAYFWQAHPDSVRFFQYMACHPALLEQVVGWHRTVRAQGSYGLLLTPELAGYKEGAQKAALQAVKDYARR
jgi:tetratricopeptide (TPR) repeat protein